jgi:hypothetical protein
MGLEVEKKDAQVRIEVVEEYIEEEKEVESVRVEVVQELIEVERMVEQMNLKMRIKRYLTMLLPYMLIMLAYPTHPNKKYLNYLRRIKKRMF